MFLNPLLNVLSKHRTSNILCDNNKLMKTGVGLQLNQLGNNEVHHQPYGNI